MRHNQCYVEFTLSCSVHSSNTEFDPITGDDDVMSLCIEDGGQYTVKIVLFVRRFLSNHTCIDLHTYTPSIRNVQDTLHNTGAHTDMEILSF